MAKRANEEARALAAEAEALLAKAGELGLNAEHKARLRNAWRLAGGTRRNREEANRIIREVEADLRRPIEDLVAAEEAAGEGVEVFNDAGAVRLHSRDGLAALQAKGVLSQDDVEVGLRYRDLLEIRTRGMRSQLDDAPGGRSGVADAVIWARLDQAKAGVLVGWIETVVVAKSREKTTRRGMRELTALRMVAGEGRMVRSFAKGSSPAAIYEAALIRALASTRLALRTWPGLAVDDSAS